MAAAARLGYQPNLAARALASRHSKLIALVVEGLQERLIAATIEATGAALQEHGYGVLLLVPKVQQGAAVRAILTSGAEGAVCVGWPISREDVAALDRSGIPSIVVSEGAAWSDPRRVDLGRLRGAELAVSYLLQQGHRRFGFLLRDAATGGQVATLLEHVGAAPTVVEVPPASDPDTIQGAVQELLAAPSRPTAILCRGDSEALAAVRACGTFGLRVPQELSVVGFGDEPLARYVRPGLTTVRVAANELGRWCAGALLDILTGRSATAHAPTIRLVIRETTGPAPA